MSEGQIAMVISIAALLVTWRQSHTDAVRLRHELFERRFAMMRAIADFLSDVMRRGRVNPDAERQLGDATRGARFLFDESIAAFLTEIHQHRARLHSLTTLREAAMDSGASVGEPAAQKEDDEFQWFVRAGETLDGRFAPFMRLEPWWWRWARQGQARWRAWSEKSPPPR